MRVKYLKTSHTVRYHNHNLISHHKPNDSRVGYIQGILPYLGVSKRVPQINTISSTIEGHIGCKWWDFTKQGTYITGVWYGSSMCQITEPVDMLVKIQVLRINIRYRSCSQLSFLVTWRRIQKYHIWEWIRNVSSI